MNTRMPLFSAFLALLVLLCPLLTASVQGGGQGGEQTQAMLQPVSMGLAESALQQPRFVDNRDGTVSDRRTGLTWLKHANCFDTQTWGKAMEIVAGISDGLQCQGMELEDGSAPGDWRLPTIREIMTLPMIEYFNPALTNSMGTGKWQEGDPFVGVSSQYYWSSSQVEDDNAWYMYLYNGVLGISQTTQRYSVWPVKGRMNSLLEVES